MVRKGEDLPNYIKNCTTNQWEQVLWSDKSGNRMTGSSIIILQHDNDPVQ